MQHGPYQTLTVLEDKGSLAAGRAAPLRALGSVCGKGFPCQGCSRLRGHHAGPLQHPGTAEQTPPADCHSTSGDSWVWLLHLPLHSCPGVLMRGKWDGYGIPCPFFRHILPLHISNLCWEQVIWTMDTWDPSPSRFWSGSDRSEYILPCQRPQFKVHDLSIDFRNPRIELQPGIPAEYH